MIRLVLVLLCLLISLLAVFRAPAFPLWLLSIIVKELPWLFVGVTVLLLIGNWGTDRYLQAIRLAGFTAIALYLSPIVRAYWASRGLEERIATAFVSIRSGNSPKTSSSDDPDPASRRGERPFRWWRMIAGIADTKIDCRVLTYGMADSVALTMDFYPAQRRHKRPCIIIVHGGSWSGGDSRQLPELNSRLANEGYHVASLNYRLAPRYQSPAPVEDIRSAFAFLKQNADKFSIDTGAFILLGRSAGAQIALLAAYTLQEPGLRGVISYYGPADMVWGYSAPSNPLIMDSRKVMSDYLGGPYETVPQNYFNSSPIEFVSRRSVPTLLIHGQQDVLVAYEHSIRLNKKLADSGVRHFLLTLPWATHGFDYSLNGPGGQLSTFCVEKFLEEITP